MAEIWRLLIFSFVSVVYLFVISKLLGKKQIAQLEFIDYVLGISIGSIAAEMATDINDTPFYYYLISMTVFFLVDLLISYLGRKGPFFKRFFKGTPNTIIYEGKIDFKELKRSKLDINDVICLCRELGYFDLNDIEYAIFERTGKMSVLPKGSQRPTVIEDITKNFEDSNLPIYTVVDGKISYSSLRHLNKDLNWLFLKLGIKNKKEIKNIILASYDEQKKKMTVHFKANKIT